MPCRWEILLQQPLILIFCSLKDRLLSWRTGWWCAESGTLGPREVSRRKRLFCLIERRGALSTPDVRFRGFAIMGWPVTAHMCIKALRPIANTSKQQHISGCESIERRVSHYPYAEPHARVKLDQGSSAVDGADSLFHTFHRLSNKRPVRTEVCEASWSMHAGTGSGIVVWVPLRSWTPGA